MTIHEAMKTGLEYYRVGNLHEAERNFLIALEKQPDNAEILYLLGTICGDLDRYDSAIEYIKRSVQINPANAVAYLALGITLQQKGLIDEAIGYYQQAIHLDPDMADVAIVYHYLGMAFQAKGSYDEAINSYQKALQANPHLIASCNNLGGVLQKKGRFEEASACYQKALLIDPHSAETYYNLGVLEQGQGRFNEASAAYDMAISLKPNYFAARWAKCISQLPVLYADHSAIEISRERYREELMKLIGTTRPETPQDIRATAETVGTQQPFHLPYQGLNDRELQQLYGGLVCRIMAAGYPEFSRRPSVPSILPSEPLRVGMVSGYFYLHPVWKIIAKGWVENIDKSKIRLYGYSTGKRKDNETVNARRHFSRFVEDVYSFEDLCATIRNDNLHALIYPEIGMDSTTVRLAALRLAPVQCASWGHPETTGLPTIDYFLSSELMEPPDGDKAYTEQLVRLPNLSVRYTPVEVPYVQTDREMFGARPESVLYHCCQTLFKFLPQYDELFPRIAQQVGDCQFFFSSAPELRAVIEQFRIRIYQAFARSNLNADNHVVFLPYLDHAGYHALNRLSDIFLDPIGWSGCTSTLEAVDCNLPVVAYPSPLMRGRESSAILTMMGLTETIAGSPDEYVALAVRLARGPDFRREISEKIAKNKHKIYGDQTCVFALEEFLLKAVIERAAKTSSS